MTANKGLFHNIRELLPNNATAFSHILVSLKTRNFRLYSGGMCVSLTGTWTCPLYIEKGIIREIATGIGQTEEHF